MWVVVSEMSVSKSILASFGANYLQLVVGKEPGTTEVEEARAIDSGHGSESLAARLERKPTYGTFGNF